MSMTLKRLTGGRRVCRGVFDEWDFDFFIYSTISYQIAFLLSFSCRLARESFFSFFFFFLPFFTFFTLFCVFRVC